jgi:tetratricopeptide (TPR) repeat protein
LIPKIIHYCWLGRAPQSDLNRRCLESWRRVLPHYRLKLWDETNVPLDSAYARAAYAAGEWSEALAELRAARRLTGDPTHLPIIADCERALGRPERALDLARSPEVGALPAAARVELRIVEAGARRDLGQLDAALVTLQGPDLDRRTVQPWTARLWYAYADTLLALGRTGEARDWFVATASIDEDGETDADDRLLALDGVTMLDTDAPAPEQETN